MKIVKKNKIQKAYTQTNVPNEEKNKIKMKKLGKQKKKQINKKS